MSSSSARHYATKNLFGLTREEVSFLRSLSTPAKVQDYLDKLSFNHEIKGETCMSPRRVMREKQAHCIEGAMLACAAFMISDRKPLVLNLKVDDIHDDDHIVVLFQENGYWGAISKTNHAVLRYRDPVYQSVRELAMSYFNEYFLVRDGKKTMYGFSNPINMRRFGTKWITEEKDLWNIAKTIYDAPHHLTVPKGSKKHVRNASKIERDAASISEGKK
jgi:hypothetical protein